MDCMETFEFDWDALIASLPELEMSARKMGALTRRRAVDSAETLLRLALVHASCDHSLRETAAWAEMSGTAKISDVALLKRFRRCGPWLGHLVLGKLAERYQLRTEFAHDLRVRLVDATHLSSPGAKGTNWRLHLGLDLESLTIDHVEFTDSRGGESLDRFPVSAGEVLIGDRGYAHRNPMVRVDLAGGHFVVRLPWSTVPLNEPTGESFDLFQFLRSLPDAHPCDASVSITSSDHQVISCRLIALRKSAAAAAAAREKAMKEGHRRRKSIDIRSLEAAEYTILLTNLEPDRLTSEQALEIYRLRWQIELAFKRFKSLLNLDHISAREPRMVRTYVLAKILGALLVEDLADRYLSFFPWGYPL